MALGQALNIYNALVETDPEGADYYKARWSALKDRLTAIDEEYTRLLSTKTRSVIYVTHATFGYLSEAYGFTQRSIVGLQADQQPSTAVIAEIMDEMAASGTRVFYMEPGYSDIYVQVVKEELHLRVAGEVEVRKLYHMNGPIEGLDYLAQMEANLPSLMEGLR